MEQKPEPERTELQEKFYKETGTPCINSQGEPDIDYVDWLEDKVIASESKFNSAPEPENKPLSWEQAKEEIVKCNGYKDWETVEISCINNPKGLSEWYKMAARHYGRHCFNQGVAEQRNSILNAPAPEFKA